MIDQLCGREIECKTNADDADDDLPLSARDVAMVIRASSGEWDEQVIHRLVQLLGAATLHSCHKVSQSVRATVS